MFLCFAAAVTGASAAAHKQTLLSESLAESLERPVPSVFIVKMYSYDSPLASV